MQQRPAPADFLQEVLTGQPSPEALAWLADGLAKWLREGDTLEMHSCFGLGTAAKSRQAIRDKLLREAAEHLTGCPSQRAATLASLASDFEARIWPVWMAEPEPPARAGRVLSLLWKCKRLGARLPTSARLMFDIIA